MLHTAADGNGPVNALDGALRKALRAFYPVLDGVHLVDYKVRILDGATATAARTRVIIDSQDGAATWSTMGSDTNIIAASAQALADSLEYAIWKSGAELRRRDERHFTTTNGRDGSGLARRPDRRPREASMTDAPAPPRRPTRRPADPLRLARWTVTSGSNVNSRAAVVIRAGDHDWKASAEGNGAVDALYKAVDPALRRRARRPPAARRATTSMRWPRARTPRARSPSRSRRRPPPRAGAATAGSRAR